MQIVLNGEPVEVEAGFSMKDFLESFGFEESVVVAVDGEHFPRHKWLEKIETLKSVEVIAPMQGG